MATILLAGLGAAMGAGAGGAVLGLSGAVIGRAVGATAGRLIDQRLLGGGARVVETGRVERFRLTGAGEGAPIPRVWGRVRLGGQVIWASRFEESVDETHSGGKGSPGIVTRTHRYAVSLAIALCEGEIVGVGRIWADGQEILKEDLNLRVYAGSETQDPDPKMEAVEGAGTVPAYRGTAYVVIEDLDLGRFGNRVPQFSFEVLRSAAGAEVPDLMQGLRAVAMIPGTGEYALATTPVLTGTDPEHPDLRPINRNTPSGRADLALSVETLRNELPNCRSVLLVVSWFGDDLRCGHCSARPKVEGRDFEGQEMPWEVSGLTRDQAGEIARLDGRVVYGGTPADAAVIEAIGALREAGQEVVFYPFLLMEQMAGNGLPDPWTGAPHQPVLPWRGRITCSVAPGRTGSPDRTAAAGAEVAAFFGAAQPQDFSIDDGRVVYAGPEDWGWRRFILHYAWLAKLAGGVAAFCVGSELRGLTQIRGAGDSFPAVEALRQLARDVRQILGADVRLTYAADWSEYFGYADGAGNRYFHLDPLWADPEIDFIGIDNYMPLSDWRDGEDHADAGAGAVWRLDYLKRNIAGGEGFDWFYPDARARAAQQRQPITDGAHGEPWVWRYKDLRGWWSNPHHERRDGVRLAQPTAWQPRSKPFWFTELGCPAVDRGTNQPNVFLDPKSSESHLPYQSSGRRDDLIQFQYLRAFAAFWSKPANNPVSPVYGGRMVDAGRMHVWAWDARPFPWFPALGEVWADGDNWARGHWITGRTAGQDLGDVVAEICRSAGLHAIDTSELHGLVRGYWVGSTETARAMLQPLMLAHGFDAVERDGVLRFRMRDGRVTATLAPGALARRDEDGPARITRAGAAELAGRVRLVHVAAEADFEAAAVEALLPDANAHGAAQAELPMVLTRAEARGIAERWLAEARVARDTVAFALPRSTRLGAGDVVALDPGAGARRWRIDRLVDAGAIEAEAVRVEPGLYAPSDEGCEAIRLRPFVPPVAVVPQFLDLPLIAGDEVPHAPRLAVSARPWPGSVAAFASLEGEGWRPNALIRARAVMGQTESPLPRAAPGLWDRGAPLRVRLWTGGLASADAAHVFAGANLMAIGDGSPDRWELFQFARAELVAPGRWDIALRLRGQLGTDAIMPEVWPAGSRVVLIDQAAGQIELPAELRGLARDYRIGPATRPLSDPIYRRRRLAFAGIGLRPYAPVHLRARRGGDGAWAVSWVRRTRRGGDSWIAPEVPLAEEREAYVMRVLVDGQIRREAQTQAPQWQYGPAAQAADGTSAGGFCLAVAQLSQAFGPGPFSELAIAAG